jgi:gluconolactonase
MVKIEKSMKIETFKNDFIDLIDPNSQIEIIAKDLTFTEGPVWDKANNQLLFSDIPEDRIYAWSMADGLSVFRSPSKFANGLTYDPSGNLVICEHQRRAITRIKKEGMEETLADSFQGMKLNSPNDVISAKDGSILFTDPIYGLRSGSGGPGKQELPFQGVYRLPPMSSELQLITDSFERPNGLVLSKDEKTLFINDTVRQHIRIFEINENWKVSGGQVWVELHDDKFDGRPDGMKLDAKGNLFSTGPGGIWVFDKNAVLLGRIYLPEKTSNLNWGDADQKSLFITSSSTVYRIRCRTSG